MYSAKEIAVWFIYKNNAEKKENQAVNDEEPYEVYEGISHLKLQKLLYYAQGVHLAIKDTKLFIEKIHAWEHGPVIPNVYDDYRRFGREYITIETNRNNDETVQKIEKDSETKRILDMVYENFAIYTAWQLREMTHQAGSPWDITVGKNGIVKEIENGIIKEYFLSEIMEK